MTAPILRLLEETVSSTPAISPDEASVMSLDIPGEAFMVRAEKGLRETVVTKYDLTNARVFGSPVAPSWTDANLVVETYHLGQLLETTRAILRDMFGQTAGVHPSIERDPESPAPSLVLWLRVPRDKRALRHQFLERYARETVIPERAPTPVLLWKYNDDADGVPA